MKRLVDLLNKADHIVLSTHRQCDGDGLGAQLAIYHALKAKGRKVQVINVDPTPKKYRFLEPDSHIQYYSENQNLPAKIDLSLIFDTNDERLVEPLFPELKKRSKVISFLDHHPVLSRGPLPTKESLIDTTAASTGELAYRLIKAAGLSLNREVARALYTSITFDTQLYRFIRNSPTSHLIAAELLGFDIHPEEVHRSLFSNHTVQKVAFLARALGQIEYHCEGRFAVLRLQDKDLFHYNLEPDESRDVIDMLMNISTLEAAALFREDGPNEFKVSLRSKGLVQVLDVAEGLGGGGHPFSAGAYFRGSYQDLKERVVREVSARLKKTPLTGT